MALPHGRLWAAVLLLGLALAAAHTASALPPQPPSSSRPKPAPRPQPTPEEQWDKATRGLKSITLSPQPEPPSGKARDWHAQVVRKWQTAAPQAPLRVYKPAVPAVTGVRGLKAVTLSPQPEPPSSRAQQGQRFARWAAAGTIPLVKAPLGSTAPLAPPVPVARAVGRSLEGLDGSRATDAKSPTVSDPVNNKLTKSFLPPPAEPKLGFSGGGVPGTGDREGGYYDACGAGTQFKTVDCSSWSSAPDLASYGRQTSTGVCDKNYIECGSGGEGRKRETYHIEVSDVHGQRSKDGKAAYYARARIMFDRKTQPDQQYCWKRVGAGGDGCGCLCAVALKGSALGRRPECRCEAV
jgi:hypothetical protein